MANHSIINVRVAGTCVRGEDRMDSDIDFYVCLPEKNEEYGTPGPIIDAEEEIADLLNVRIQVIEEWYILPRFEKRLKPMPFFWPILGPESGPSGEKISKLPNPC